MTTPLPNPFVMFPLAATSTVDSAAVACVGDASQATADPHVTPLPPEPVAEFVPDEDFMDRLYASIVGASDAMPVFLRRPSPQFMQALFRLAN
jgi:hypothetical protein